MVATDEEKKIINNFTDDYEKFIKKSSIDEIKRSVVIQKSTDPKDQKFVKKILEQLEKKKKEMHENKFKHRLSVRMGINL